MIAKRIQTDLQRQNFVVGDPLKFADGDFGGKTLTALQNLQTTRGLPASGAVEQVTWQQLTSDPLPSLFERCLQVTAAFEGHGFGLAKGNFDGAGITWGVIGFTLSNREIQAILTTAEQHTPGTLLRVIPSTNTWSITADFTSLTGSAPAGTVLAAPDGTLYGLTTSGGASGHGTLWRYTSGAGLEALISFTGNGGPAPGSAGFVDGGTLITGGLALASDGTLYGVLPGGGSSGGGSAFRYSFATPLSAWKQTHLGDANAPDSGDPDNDGIATLAEYALLLLPEQSDAAQLPPIAFSSGGALQITLPRDPARYDATIIVEAAGTPAGPWTPLAVSTGGAPFTGSGYVSGDDPAAGIKSVIIRDLFSTATARRRFLRLRVTR